MKITGESFLELAYTLVRIRDLDVLLETILKRIRGMLGADAGSIFIYDDEKDELIFKYTQNDSVQLPFKEFSIPANEESIAGYVAKTGSTLRLKDVYHLEDEYPFGFNVSFDKMSGYRTKSVLAFPITDLNDQLTGVLQIINKKRYEVPLTLENVNRIVLPFNDNDEMVAESLTGVISLALENGVLYDNLEKMNESFITELSKALENREPFSMGHVNRVTAICETLASEMHRDLDDFPDFFMNRLKDKILRYSCRLHDIGKLFVPEKIFAKSGKLYPGMTENIENRFRLAKACARLGGRPKVLTDELDRLLAVIKDANISDIDDKIAEDLAKCVGYIFEDSDGEDVKLLSEEEYALLSIREGIYTEDELKSLRFHALGTYEFLRNIPWTAELRDVPVIAASHHEKPDGTGYPFGTTDADLHIFSKIMAVAEGYDHYTADPRPCGQSMMPEEAAKALRKDAESGALDKKIVNFFINKEIYKRF
ncbi:GAF and HD-GYP domain-containing protein [Geovibrio thiophilus]|uniref:GAF and HD-GYP domain-containing protein n=1 Tax=Geovibrio thiophilus TaxID=139438 RepID=UPI0013E2ACEF|nr:HD family phosphohydrolase [Geovibrio thiophilus]